MFVWIAVGTAAAALVATMLRIPVEARASADLTAFCGYGEIRITWLCFGVRIPVRLRLLCGERPRLELLRGDGMVKKQILLAKGKTSPSKWGKALRMALDIRRVRAAVSIGIEGAPAATALLCGAVEHAAADVLKMLLPMTSARVWVTPVFSQDALQLQFAGIVRVRLGKLIRSRLRIGANSK